MLWVVAVVLGMRRGVGGGGCWEYVGCGGCYMDIMANLPLNFSSIFAIRSSTWVSLSAYFVTASVRKYPSVGSSATCMAVPKASCPIVVPPVSVICRF